MMMRIYWFISPIVAMFPLLQPLYGAEPKEEKRVLILHSEDKDNPSQEMVEQGIREAFRSNKLFDVQLYNEYLDVSRFGGPSHARAIADLLRHKYSGTAGKTRVLLRTEIGADMRMPLVTNQG